MTDDIIVGRKDIIEYLRKPLDLSPNQRIAWNKIYRWRKQQGMEKVFHRDITGRPFIIKAEVREWLKDTDGKREYVPQGFLKKDSKEILPEKRGDSQ